MQNIEFKAELRNIEAARTQCAALPAVHIGTLTQTDLYFKLSDGRLKRRSAPGEPVEWIFYHRPDRASPRMSNYSILSDEQAKRRWGTESLKPWLTVVKLRDLWMFGEVRIHMDEVEGLGCFLEFEAKVSRRFNVKACHDAIAELRNVFAPVLGEPVSASYSDLMAMEAGVS